MLTATGFLEASERAQIYNIALGEKSIPLSIFGDKYPEELEVTQGYFSVKKGQRMTID